MLHCRQQRPRKARDRTFSGLRGHRMRPWWRCEPCHSWTWALPPMQCTLQLRPPMVTLRFRPAGVEGSVQLWVLTLEHTCTTEVMCCWRVCCGQRVMAWCACSGMTQGPLGQSDGNPVGWVSPEAPSLLVPPFSSSSLRLQYSSARTPTLSHWPSGHHRITQCLPGL